MTNLPSFATYNHVLSTEDDCYGDNQCVTKFESPQELERFAEWMDYVHTSLNEAGITESDLSKLGINVWDHSEIYKLFKHRKGFTKFFENLAEYSNKIFYNHYLEEGCVVDHLRIGKELE